MSEDQAIGLEDIAPRRVKVFLNEEKTQFVWVQGWSYATIADLLQRFPILQNWVLGSGFKLSDLAYAAPDFIAAAVAAALCGKSGNLEVEAKAAALEIEVQMDVMQEAGKLTFKSGFGPFVERIALLADVLLSVSVGRAQAMNSLRTSNPSLPADTPQTSPGV